MVKGIEKSKTDDSTVKKLYIEYNKSVEKIKAGRPLLGMKSGRTSGGQPEGSPGEQSEEDYVMMALLEAERVWLNVKVLTHTNKDFYAMSDENKIDLIRRDFAEFYNEFPIVSRYMMCMGQYNRKAFSKFLKKCQQTLSYTNSNQRKKDDHMQKIWIERRADYIKYLWEEYQTGHINTKESHAIWQQAYDALTKEFAQFKELHDNMENKIKQDDARYKKELVAELTGRMVRGEQSIAQTDMENLLAVLQSKLFKQRFKKVIVQILNDVKYINPIISGRGRNDDAEVEYKEELQLFEMKKKYKKMEL